MSYELIDCQKKSYKPNNYVQKYYDELFNSLLEYACDVNLISHNENFVNYVKNKQDISSFYVMTLSILADNIEDVYYDMTDVYRSPKVEYALGDDLDSIGMSIGCPRPSATRAGVELTFELSIGYDETIVIPKGFIVSTRDGVSYYTAEKVSIPIGETTVKVYALAMEAGLNSRVNSRTLTLAENVIYLSDGSVVGVNVVNELSSSGGRERYNDEEYRELLLNWIKSNIKGSKEAYDRYFASVDGVDSYKLVPNWNGVSGTVKVIIDPGYPYQLKECYGEIVRDVCQFSEDISLFAPSRVPIDIYARCNVDIDEINPYSSEEKDQIKSRIEDAIKVFITGDNYNYTGLKIGEDFIPYKLGVFISQQVPELKNINFYQYNNTGSLEIAEPVEITDEEMGTVNTITIMME